MAYITCKHCGTKMSDKSEACPVCGVPVEEDLPPELPNEIPSERPEESEKSEEQPTEQAVAPKSPKKAIAIGSAIVILLLAIATGIFLYITHTGINSSIYKPLSKNTIKKYNEKYEDFNGFYYMVQQMKTATQKNKAVQARYEEITYKRLTTYMYEVYRDLSIEIPSLSKTYNNDWEVVGPAYDKEYLQKRYEFQNAAVKQAINRYEKQCREPIKSQINEKKKEWKQYIEDCKPENYLTVIPKYGYKKEGLIFIDYRPKFYFEIREPKGALSDAIITYWISGMMGKQQMILADLKRYNCEDNYRYFSDIDDSSFWDKYSINVEINSVTIGHKTINMGDEVELPEIVKNYLEKPDYSNECQFVRQYIKADYPVYECYVEDIVLAKMKKKDPLCFDFIHKYSNAVMARSTLSKNTCKEVIKDFYAYTNPKNRFKYLSRRLFNYTSNKTDNYLYNHDSELSMPVTVNVEPQYVITNTYHVSFNGKYDDVDILMVYENGNWKIDNFKTTNSSDFLIDYSKQTK